MTPPDDRRRRPDSGGLVYSTDAGRMCPGCRQPVAACTCRVKPESAASADGIVRVGRENKGRGGKTVTVIRGLAADAAGLERTARQLKAACGSGGTVKEGAIEIQGDHRERVLEVLTAQGHRVKRAGG